MPVEAKADALIGTLLEGRFQIERLLGEGGMGRVYVADETRLRRRCALKVLLPELSEDKDCVERFLREAQAIAQIHHENVVDIYHLGEDAGSGVVFFAMELLQGEDLETRLLDRVARPVTWDQVCHWIAQAAAAVGAVHQAGMIHRDLKPSNIFVARRRDGRERVKLLDFGIAKAVNRAALTGAGAALGTPYYMSPEQILALPLDQRSDIYSLGAVFFEALAGRMVFQGEPLQVAMQHCNMAAPRVRDIAQDEIPPEVDALVYRMLAKEPSARPQTMEEIEDMLLNFAPSIHNSGLILRPQTHPLTAQSGAPVRMGARRSAPVSAAGPSASPSASPFASPSADPFAAPGAGPLPRTPDPNTSPLARTALAINGPRQGSTVEFHLDVDPSSSAVNFPVPAPLPAPALRGRTLAIIFGAVALAFVAAIMTLFVLPRGDPPAVVGELAPSPVEPPRTSQVPVVHVEPVVEPVVTPPEPEPPEPEPPAVEPDPGGKPAPVVKPRKPDRSGPMKLILRKATACRKSAKALRGPKITIDYAISRDGHVNRAVPSTQDALGKCLAAAVKGTKFPPLPELKLGLRVDL
ncbi:MAG: protein kinase [Nannocystis sp.]|nr:serine/threonine protein kinase [Nannocystis sp.]MBA3549794.1 protein kinase [Nannocystis sp.]